MAHTIPKKALVALPDFTIEPPMTRTGDRCDSFVIVPPEKAVVSAFDRSFHFGDSLYEVTRSYEGILFSLDEHMRRLENSCQMAMYETLPDFDQIQSMIRQTCRAFFSKFGNIDVYVRVLVSRGMGDLNIDRDSASAPYFMVFVKELPSISEKLYQDGMHYAVVERRRNPPSALDPAMKSGNYLNNILALAEAKKMGASDAILLNQYGFVTEGTTNNVYMVNQNTIWTAPLSAGILAGITRHWIFELCKKEGIPCEERLFTRADLATCQEMFLSSSIKEVMPITTLNDAPVGGGKPGPITKTLHKAMKKLIASYVHTHRAESLYV